MSDTDTWDWSHALKIEQEFAKCLVEQKRKGFLVDKSRMEEHICTLNTYIEDIDERVAPQLPKRCVPQIKRSKGVFPYVKKPFLKSGKYSQAVTEWIEAAYNHNPPEVVGVFTRINFIPFDLGSVAQIKNYLLDVGWKPEEWNVSKLTGKRTSPKISGDDNFRGVESTVGFDIVKRVKYRHRKSQLEGWLKMIRADGRITADVTGLTPTARLKHKTIVNIPGGEYDEDGNWKGAVFGHEMREVFIVPEGYNLIGCDAASCQLRMLCHYMGDAAYTEAVINGKKEDGTDIHSLNMVASGCQTRGAAKTFIYALLFGASDNRIASQIGCTKREATNMRAKFIKNLPNVERLIKGITRAWMQRGHLIGIDGRPVYVRSAHMLLVYLLQSAEAIMMKVATLYAHKSIRAGGYDATMVAHVHDEFQFEVLDKDSTAVSKILEESIVKAGEYLKLTVPMAGTADIGKNWAETH